MALWILREPTPQYPLLLLVHLQDAPEAGESETAEYGRNGLVGNEQGRNSDHKAHDQPNPPAALAKMILHLYDGRMTDTDAEEHSCADYDSANVYHYLFIFDGTNLRQCFQS